LVLEFSSGFFCESISRGSLGCYCTLLYFIKCIEDLLNRFIHISMTNNLIMLYVLFKFQNRLFRQPPSRQYQWTFTLLSAFMIKYVFHLLPIYTSHFIMP
jgi:hypothetical protein